MLSVRGLPLVMASTCVAESTRPVVGGATIAIVAMVLDAKMVGTACGMLGTVDARTANTCRGVPMQRLGTIMPSRTGGLWVLKPR